ncbi:transmembrane protein 164-like isoform X2 [Portunus trituberculatus]|uniref:transmembrane protein 164-like isoform X2 n=1 Tax=Portunus trituberculatus TaxID=210409 RepID=UPI001E1CCBE7|nr:transmembrane protein 164-like isoform X2 [Portunus trituberculatus]
MALSGRYTWENVLDWGYGGVDPNIPGNGGPQCASFLSLHRRLLETLLGCAVPLFYVFWGYSNITCPASYKLVRKDRGGKRALLVLVSMIFGTEIGFKLSSKQIIYLLNPCHVTTAIQIYLLAAPPSRFVTAVFRVHLNFLNGAVLALIFPVTNSRQLPFEMEMYWVEHVMMLVTPYYLLRLGGVYTVEDQWDMSWTIMSLGILLIYHFLPLQLIGMLSQVNLNNMLCPAISDPFYGPNYRIAAMLHQSLCVPLISKTFCFVANFFITKFPPTKIKDTLALDVTMSGYDQRHDLTYTPPPSPSTTPPPCCTATQGGPRREGDSTDHHHHHHHTTSTTTTTTHRRTKSCR